MTAPHSTAARQRGRARRELGAAVGIVLAIALVTVIAFAQPDPLSETQTVDGVFSTIAQISPGSEVRVGGQMIGRVTSIGRGPQHTSLVRMELDERGPALRRDARLKIVPRLALEGNAYIDVEPGRPSSPMLGRSAVIPLSRTSVSVQLDQAISTFDAPARKAVGTLVDELSGGLGIAPLSADAPRSGATELRAAARELDATLAPLTQAARAARGERDGDLARATRGLRDVAAQASADPDALGGLVTNYARLSRRLATQDADVRDSLREMAATTAEAPAQLRRIRSALPSLTRFARTVRPTLDVAPRALASLEGAAREVRAISAPDRLPRFLDRLEPLTAEFPRFQTRLLATLPQAEAIGECLVKTLVPALNQTVPDGSRSTGRPVWQEALHMASGIAGAASAFDGNGGALRLGVTEGEQAVGIHLGDYGALTGWLPSIDEIGLNPTWLGYGVSPPWRPDAACADQPLPDLGARRRAGLPPSMRALDTGPRKTATSADILDLLKRITPETLLREAVR